ncbi:MAG: PQQ-binding-like beta-propeller repeat protein, partial [Candidatus Sumerlaeia bacterium]|nr:PQQ-binding-like beta-propeller repeat protein [Candidatus Sumerlaeia bacterium]
VKNNVFNRDMIIPLKKSSPPEINVLPITSENEYTLVVKTINTDDDSTCSYSLNSSREFKPLKEIRPGLFADQIPYRELCPGSHKVIVRFTSEKQGEWRKISRFEIPHRKNKVVFTFQTQAAIQSSPVIRGKRLYFGSNDGNIYCINSKNGKLLWQYKTGAEVIAVPAVEKNMVYTGSLDGNFYALDAKSGKIMWSYPVGAPVLASATVSKDKVFFGAGDFKLRALSKKDGTLLWEFPTGRLIKMKPVVAGDKILFGSWDGYFYCLRTDNGKLIWKEQISSNPLYAPATSNPLVVDNKVIFVAHNYTTHCLDLETGKRLWSFPGTDESKPSYNSGAYFDESVFFGSITGHLVSFNVNDGKLRFATPLKSLAVLDPVFDSSPVIYKKTAFLGSIGGYIYGVDCQTGQLKWQFALQNGYIFSSPAIHKGILYIGDCAGKIYAIKVKL